MVIVLNDLRQRFLHDSVQGQFVPPPPSPLRFSAKAFAVHKNGCFYGQSLQKTTVVHRKGRSHGQIHENLRFIHKKGGFCGQDEGLSTDRDQSSGDYI